MANPLLVDIGSQLHLAVFEPITEKETNYTAFFILNLTNDLIHWVFKVCFELIFSNHCLSLEEGLSTHKHVYPCHIHFVPVKFGAQLSHLADLKERNVENFSGFVVKRMLHNLHYFD